MPASTSVSSGNESASAFTVPTKGRWMTDPGAADSIAAWPSVAASRVAVGAVDALSPPGFPMRSAWHASNAFSRSAPVVAAVSKPIMTCRQNTKPGIEIASTPSVFAVSK